MLATPRLHAWRRELYELLPYLHVTEVKCGWLYKKGETANAGFKKRYCMLFSSYRWYLRSQLHACSLSLTLECSTSGMAACMLFLRCRRCNKLT